MNDFKTPTLLVLALTFLNLVLLLVNIGAIQLPQKTVKKEISVYKVGKEIKIAGYKIKFTNPTYEFDKELLFDSFKVDVVLENENFKPFLMPIFNCDIVDGKEMVLEDSGVILNESHELLTGESHDYIVTVPLEIDYTKQSQGYSENDGNAFPNRRVPSCKFTPTGSYDPNISIEVVFQ